MAKGLFTQGICVLLKEPMSMAEVTRRMSMFNVAGRQHTLESDDAPETLILDYRTEVEGHMLITPSSAPWPDDMGEPDENPEAFVAWSLGQFGPLTYPGCLQRALECIHLDPQLRRDAAGHQAHVRVLISYVIGNEEDDDSDDDLPLMPDGYEATDELHKVTRAVTSLLESPQSICYFNPASELILSQDELRSRLNAAWNEDTRPLDAWIRTRRLITDNGTDSPDWHVIDTVGHGQLDIPDLEAVFVGADYDSGQVIEFLEKMTDKLLICPDEGDTFFDGQLIDGPGDVPWSAINCGDALNSPPRPTVRWVPQDDHTIPEIVQDDMNDDDVDEEDETPDWLSESDLKFLDDDDEDLTDEMPF